jgi:UDP-N-acetyl-D-galactosamine dehydrogenase
VEVTVGVVGLGYVGLPLAVMFANKYTTIGYDINSTRIESLKAGFDITMEVDGAELSRALELQKPFGLQLTLNPSDLAICDFIIVTVPTPINEHNYPDLSPLKAASNLIGSIMKKGATVIYESTVYPGVTEEVCVPILERQSGLKLNEGFYVGYSPERINPGDKTRSIKNIVKITSGSSPQACSEIDKLYNTVLECGTHQVSSIKVAEAAKVIENAQRDINIAFMNEIAKIFAHLHIDTQEVLSAAATKWNFMPFSPGLVGGHCIGVDPFYLAQKAQDVGYYTDLILTARRLNDSMGKFVADQVIKKMNQAGVLSNRAKALVLGFTFKENCTDTRNTKVIDVVKTLQDFGLQVDILEPLGNQEEIEINYKVNIISTVDAIREQGKRYEAVILCVAHEYFKSINVNMLLSSQQAIIYDVKGILEGENIHRL